MTIPYPEDYFGPIGLVKCCECELIFDEDESIQDDWNYQIYCEHCHDLLIEAREEAEEDLIEKLREKEALND